VCVVRVSGVCVCVCVVCVCVCVCGLCVVCVCSVWVCVVCVCLIVCDNGTLNKVMRRVTTFRSTTDRIYDGGPIRLQHNIIFFYSAYHCVTISYSIQYSNVL